MTYPDPDRYVTPADQPPVMPGNGWQQPTQGPYRPAVVPASPPHPPMGYPQPPYYQQHVVVASSPPTSGLAVASMIFGLIGFFGGFCLFGVPCLVAVALGHAALRETKGGTKGGHGMAITGLILGYLLLIPAVLIVAMGGLGSVIDGVDGPR